MSEIELKCSCGKLKGTATNVSESCGTRIVCCCDDCQSFARFLNQENAVLDQYGGTDIFQMPLGNFKITQGIEQISSIRLSAKGMFRWYAKCCNTPIGNTMGSGLPFIGVIHNIMDTATSRDEELGQSRGHIQTKFARQQVPIDLQGSALKINLRSLSKLIIWKIKGLNKPAVFFDNAGKPIVEPKILK